MLVINVLICPTVIGFGNYAFVHHAVLFSGCDLVNHKAPELTQRGSECPKAWVYGALLWFPFQIYLSTPKVKSASRHVECWKP
jgi:hypothetical protein